MTSYSGSVAYLKYVSKTDKGGIAKGDTFNSAFSMAPEGGFEDAEARRNFTSQVIVEAYGTALSLTPIANGRFTDAAGAKKDVKLTKKADGTAVYGTVVKTESTTTITWDGSYVPVAEDKVAYFSEEFQMEHVPAQDIPTIGPKIEHIALVAEPRRIAVKYDQITA